MKGKKLLALLLALAMVMSVFGCAKKEEEKKPETTETAAEEPKTNGFVGVSGGGSEAVFSVKDSLVYRLNADLATIDPHKTNSTGNERIVEGNIYESLWGIDMFNGKTEVNARLAHMLLPPFICNSIIMMNVC